MFIDFGSSWLFAVELKAPYGTEKSAKEEEKVSSY